MVTRGRDPELFWMNKYHRDEEIASLIKALAEGTFKGSTKDAGIRLAELMSNQAKDNREEALAVDIRSLYRHEHIAPETLIKNLYREVEAHDTQADLFGSVNDLFGNALDKDELEKVSDYYSHHDGWTNRLIQGDSHLVMASLLEREGMAGQVQMIYMDPPYGIKYGSNWQIKLNNRDVKDGSDDHLTGEPEVIKAFRDTWELGIHSYLSYIRDRLLIARELLTESGSCFVQISDENVHLVRSVMDEVFGSENFVSLITFAKTTGLSSNFLYGICDYIIWYSKDIEKGKTKYRQLYTEKVVGGAGASKYSRIELPDGERRLLTKEEKRGSAEIPQGARFWVDDNLTSQGNPLLKFSYQGKEYSGTYKTNITGLENLARANRIYSASGTLRFVRYFDDFPVYPLNSAWMDIGGIQSRLDGKVYVVQTATEAVKRCLLMTTDPGDLVLDPTCGSGTTAYVAEQFGRRWITTDTSRIALNIAKERILTATFPYYQLYDETGRDIRQGFIYKTVPHVTLKSIAQDEVPTPETLYDKPEIDTKKMRVSGPFTVETLQNFEPVSPEDLAAQKFVGGEKFEDVIKAHLEATGIKNGRSNEHTMFTHIEMQGTENLHGYGFYESMSEPGATATGGSQTTERKAYFHIGPKFGTVSKKAVNAAIRECQSRGDAQWLVILGFSFESDIEGGVQHTPMGNFTVTRVRIHDDLLQEGLKKKPAKSAASFVTIGEPEIRLHREAGTATVEIQGLDIYDPIKDEIKARDLHDIAYWMVDDDYDGSNFVVRQVFFCGGDKDEFRKWKKGLSNLAKDETRRRAEKTLKIEIDEEAFDRIYGYRSHPIKIKSDNQRIAVRVISQYGEESTKILNV